MHAHAVHMSHALFERRHVVQSLALREGICCCRSDQVRSVSSLVESAGRRMSSTKKSKPYKYEEEDQVRKVSFDKRVR